MSTRRFIVVAVVLGVALLLAISPVGGIVGFFVGVAIAFFVAGPAMLLGLTQDGFNTILMVAGGAWAALLLWQGVLILREVTAGDADAARGRAGTALAIIVVPLALWLSTQTLQAMWP